MRSFLRNSSYLCESRVPFSTSFHHFYSSSAEKKPEINGTVYDLLLKKHHFSPEAATKVASAIPRLRNPEKSDSLLSFLKRNEFSNSHLEKILKYKPSFISTNLENIVKPRSRFSKNWASPRTKLLIFVRVMPPLSFAARIILWSLHYLFLGLY